jgi:hypothetical protein
VVVSGEDGGGDCAGGDDGGREWKGALRWAEVGGGSRHADTNGAQPPSSIRYIHSENTSQAQQPWRHCWPWPKTTTRSQFTAEVWSAALGRASAQGANTSGLTGLMGTDRDP